MIYFGDFLTQIQEKLIFLQKLGFHFLDVKYNATSLIKSGENQSTTLTKILN